MNNSRYGLYLWPVLIGNCHSVCGALRWLCASRCVRRQDKAPRAQISSGRMRRTMFFLISAVQTPLVNVSPSCWCMDFFMNGLVKDTWVTTAASHTPAQSHTVKLTVFCHINLTFFPLWLSPNGTLLPVDFELHDSKINHSNYSGFR